MAPPSATNTHDLQVEILRQVVERLDRTLEKVVDVNSDVNKLLAVHDNRINNLDNTLEMSKRQSEKQEDKNQIRYEELSRKLDTKFDEFEDAMSNEIEKVIAANKESHDLTGKKVEDLDKRVADLEKLKFQLFGGVTVLIPITSFVVDWIKSLL